VTCKNGDYQIVQDLAVDAASRTRMTATENELKEQREGVKDLLG
jgi:malate dehydrogenase